VADSWVIYDLLLRDHRHVRLLKRAGFSFRAFDTLGGEHTISAFLAEVGLLHPAVLDVVCKLFDPAAFRSAALAKSSGPAQALRAQSSSTSKSRIIERLELLQQALRIALDNSIVLSRLGIELAWTGRINEAIELHHRALSQQPGQPTLLIHLSCSLELAGDLDAAHRLMEQACSIPGCAGCIDRGWRRSRPAKSL